MCVGTKTRDALMKSRTSVRTGGTAHMQNYKTEELVRQAKRQDADAFTELMQLHMKDMSPVAIVEVHTRHIHVEHPVHKHVDAVFIIIGWQSFRCKQPDRQIFL